MKLSDLKNGQTAYIAGHEGSGAFSLRLEEMGFVPGQEVTRVYASPLGSPIVFAMLGQKVALRRSEARLIVAAPTAAEAETLATAAPVSAAPQAPAVAPPARQCSGRHCAGCPGCGTRQHRHRHGRHRHNPLLKPHLTVALVGNPNCGKTAFFNAACGGHERTGNYAGVTVTSVEGFVMFEGKLLRVVDLPGSYSLQAFSPEEAYVAGALGRGDIDVIINVLDATNLERNLLLTLGLQETGLPMVGALNMYDELEGSNSRIDLQRLSSRLGMPLVPTVASRGRGVRETLARAVELGEAHRARKAEAADAATAEALRRGQAATSSLEAHARIHQLLEGVYDLRESRAARLTAVIDRFMARTPVAYLLFFLLMGLIFYATFELGAYPMDWMETGVEALSAAASAHMAPGWLRDLLVSGVLGGVGSVIVFLPNILILYFFISILEDSGYMARTALLADPLLRRVGLHGKSFIPMLMGFGCNVPAVMATRTIESRKSRLITMMVLPFMSCSARLPVYTVLAGAFFPRHAAAVMLALYAGGIAVAFAAAALLSRVYRQNEESHFVMEMPPYRMPVGRSVARHTWEKGRQYLRKMGGIILVASVAVWALGYFPTGTNAGTTPAQQQEQSYLGRVGHAIEPALRPLGYDWRMGVGILSGIGAKELMVSTLGVLYNVPEADDEAAGEASLSEAIARSGTTPAAGLSYLVFALLYFPCIATIAAIKGESGRWKYALFTAVYTTLVAYIAAWGVYRLALMWL